MARGRQAKTHWNFAFTHLECQGYLEETSRLLRNVVKVQPEDIEVCICKALSLAVMVKG